MKVCPKTDCHKWGIDDDENGCIHGIPHSELYEFCGSYDIGSNCPECVRIEDDFITEDEMKI